MGSLFSKPKAPPMPKIPEPPPPPPTDDQLSVSASEEQRRKKKVRRGLQSTILAGSTEGTTTILGG